MTQDEIIRMAREAGWDEHNATYDTRIERFAAIIAAHEREACAKVCEEEAVNVKWNDYIEGCEDCAAAIRARGNDK